MCRAAFEKDQKPSREGPHSQAEVNVMNEVLLLREIQHPFVVTMFGTHKTKGLVCLVFEPLLGGDMFTFLTSTPTGMLPERDVPFYAAIITLAFGHLHSHSVVYRDLKPENVMLCPDGYVKLIDFGYAKKLRDRTFSVVGTVEYLAPEVIAQRGHMFGADWWALGVMVYEMLCGFTPYTEHGNVVNEMQICRNITSPSYRFAFPSWLTPVAQDFILKLLTRDAVGRLGCGGGGVRDVMAHPLFCRDGGGVDFDALLCKRVAPPHLPTIGSGEDTRNFDDEDSFSAEPIDIAADPPYEEDPMAWDFFL